MAKLSFTKLGISKNTEVVSIHYNDQVIEIKQYLPINDKLQLISNVINLSADDNNFCNPVKKDVYFALQVIEFYTNISFTEKQKEDPTKLYDLLIGSGLFTQIHTAIPTNEISTLYKGVKESIEAVYNYRNSVLGILDTISADYSALNLDATEIQKKLADPNNLELLKAVMTKLG